MFGAIFLLFWLGALEFPEIVARGAAPFRLTLGPVWESFYHGYYAAIALLALVGVALGLANFVRSQWSRLRLGIRAAANAASAVIMAVVLAAHGAEVKAQWVLMTGPRQGVGGIEAAESWINISVFATLAIAAIVCAVECALYVRRIVRFERAQKLI